MSSHAFRRITFGAVAAVMSCALITQIAHASTLDIDYLTPNVNNYYTGLPSSEKIGQSFIPNISGQLTSVGFVVQRNDCRGCSSLTIAVEGADANKLPNGTRLATESITHYALPGIPGQVTTVNFTTPTSVEAGNRYTLVLEADAGARYTWYYADDLYTGEVWASRGKRNLELPPNG